MGSFKNETLSREFDIYVGRVNSTKGWDPSHQSELFKGIADEYLIGKHVFMLNIPRSVLRPNGVCINELVYDCGEDVENNECIQMAFQVEVEGICSFKLWIRNGFSWTDSQRRDIELLLQLTHYISMSKYLADLLDNNMIRDVVTGAFNQVGFFVHIEKLMKEHISEEYYALFFNISNFKYVNKIFNQQEGDIVLCKYSAKIQQFLGENEILARMGGDNFVVVIHKERVNTFIKYINCFEIEHEANNVKKKFVFGATIGASSMEGIRNSREIMGRCTMAYQAARRSLNKIVFFSNELKEHVEKQQEAAVRFNEALQNHEFVIYYQPKVYLDTFEICGAEALVRWIRDEKIIPPMQFIPVLEENGNICRLDYYVLNEVCRTMTRWKKEGKELVTVSVNFSRKHLDEEGFASKVIGIIDYYQLDHKYIEIELTESKDFQDYSIMTNVVKEFKDKGISCSIDDFGTGYSSLNMLKNTPFDIVKIDRSFVPVNNNDQLRNDDADKEHVMFRNIMKMIEDMGMKSIAEGVEQKEQLDFLKNSRCFMVQGYIFDKPLPVKEFEARLEKRKYVI